MNLPVLTSAQMRTAEEAAFARGVEVEALMDKAGAGIAQAVTRFFGKPGKCIVFAGKGHNAGDALVAAERLRRLGWKIEVRLAFQEADRDWVIADFTVTIGFAKPGLLADEALNFVGRLEVVQLDELRAPEKTAKEVVAALSAFRELLPRRKFSTYKNQCGRIGVVAGSRGFIGAALMTSQGALRAGAGLVEVFVPEEIYEIV